ncbi:hypothetical protein GUJ93_ZPchr0002g25704 [Zizania palustris]|uniref:Uncharacterized protein n=1 Tax=Zizania palustris TaxID=103762 RepID=A0A8J5RMR5_ZIZPA|nr:hypothetical protein GUJ93_ZPchr0002g25704 [Zizania palustris]
MAAAPSGDARLAAAFMACSGLSAVFSRGIQGRGRALCASVDAIDVKARQDETTSESPSQTLPSRTPCWYHYHSVHSPVARSPADQTSAARTLGLSQSHPSLTRRQAAPPRRPSGRAAPPPAGCHPPACALTGASRRRAVAPRRPRRPARTRPPPTIAVAHSRPGDPARTRPPPPARSRTRAPATPLAPGRPPLAWQRPAPAPVRPGAPLRRAASCEPSPDFGSLEWRLARAGPARLVASPRWREALLRVVGGCRQWGFRSGWRGTLLWTRRLRTPGGRRLLSGWRGAVDGRGSAPGSGGFALGGEGYGR